MSRFRLLCAALLGLLLVVSVSVLPAEASGPRTWPRGRVTYVDQTKDSDAVKRAVRIWNRSGIKVRFIKVKNPRRAQLKIRNSRRVPGGCGTGLASLGYVPGGRAFVNILHGTDADGQGCAWPGQTLVLAHELGHVLGLDHYMRSCSLMNTSHTNGVAPSVCIGDDFDLAKPGTWRCRVLEKIDLARAKRMYGGKVRVSKDEWCPAADRIPTTGPVVPATDASGNMSLTITRAAEPALPEWLGSWGYGEPGFEVHATPGACTAVPGDDATTVTSNVWGDVPVGASTTARIPALPAGPQCLTTWQFDRGYNFSDVPAQVMVTGTGTRTATRIIGPVFRAPVREFAH